MKRAFTPLASSLKESISPVNYNVFVTLLKFSVRMLQFFSKKIVQQINVTNCVTAYFSRSRSYCKFLIRVKMIFFKIKHLTILETNTIRNNIVILGSVCFNLAILSFCVAGSPYQYTVGKVPSGGTHKVEFGGPGVEKGEVGTKSMFSYHIV